MMMFFVCSVCFLPSASVTSTLPGSASLPVPLNTVTLFFFIRYSMPYVFQHHLVFSLLHVGEGELNSRRLHTEIGGVLHLFVDVGRHQHLLRGNTSAKRARSSETVIFFDDCCFQTQLPGANGGYISAWSTADNRYIKLFIGQFV